MRNLLVAIGILLVATSCTSAAEELANEPGTNIAFRRIGKLGVGEFYDAPPSVLELRSPDGSVEVVNPPDRPWTPFAIETTGPIQLCWWSAEADWEREDGALARCGQVEIVDGAFIEVGNTRAGEYLCVLDEPNNEVETACEIR